MKKNHNKYLNLRKKYPFFEFQSYSFQLKNQILTIEFCFNISGTYQFNPILEIPPREFYDWEKLDRPTLNNLIFHIGMIELVNYWKVTCSPNVVIIPHTLEQFQIDWWKKLYYHGLGEFFYLNGIETDINSFMKITSDGKALTPSKIPLVKKKTIVPVGGGKDSVVSLELLKQSDFKIIPMALNPREAIKRTICTAGFNMNESIVINRTLDPLLHKLNDRGYLNGHTPYSALLAFVNLLVALGSGSKYIALSNESSASQSTIPGTKINHQYSKSVEFEQDFRTYASKFIHHEVEYFSFLRPLNELQITRIFSKLPQHFAGFRSCNAGSKTDSWCGKCPKCLFTDIILSPFISEDTRFSIFNKNLLDDPALEKIFNELTGITEIKPFECVGMPEEVTAALNKYAEGMNETQYPTLLKQFRTGTEPEDWRSDFQTLMHQFDHHHFVPDVHLNYLKQELNEDKNGFKHFLINELAGVNSVLILGFGKEGRSSYNLLRKYFPGLPIGIADQNVGLNGPIDQLNDPNLQVYLGDRYLDALKQFELVIKSPGIKFEKENKEFTVSFTSQTELFLRFYRDQVIGVTGTKGKSTTVSLIQHFLHNAGVKSVLLGNIGVPAFDLVNIIDDDTVIVFELSAHQLQDIRVSPHIAVLLNIYPEHLDHFESFEDYKSAKLNVGKYQSLSDKIFVGEELSDSVANCESEVNIVTPSLKRGTLTDSGLLGEHNLYNIEVAISVALLFGAGREQMIQSIHNFTVLPHRLEYVGTYGQILFYNDSISTIPESTIAAVQTIPGVDTLLLGGFDRGIDFSRLVAYLEKTEIRNYIFMGLAGDKMMQLFSIEHFSERNFIKVNRLEEAFEIIPEYTRPGKVCLLSPAASSYDQFHNFEHRGDLFKKLARLI